MRHEQWQGVVVRRPQVRELDVQPVDLGDELPRLPGRTRPPARPRPSRGAHGGPTVPPTRRAGRRPRTRLVIPHLQWRRPHHQHRHRSVSPRAPPQRRRRPPPRPAACHLRFNLTDTINETVAWTSLDAIRRSFRFDDYIAHAKAIHSETRVERWLDELRRADKCHHLHVHLTLYYASGRAPERRLAARTHERSCPRT